jgi:hypothetical protein
MAEAYCPKCQPKKVTILPLDDGDVGANKYDIDESEIAMPVQAVKSSPAITFNNDPDTGLHAVGGEPADFAICGPSKGKSTTFSIDGSAVIVAYDDLPKNAAQGQMAVKKGEDVTYVYDGEEWQNLGEALLGKKRNVLTPKDEKIDRRGAIAATKAKDDA